MNIGKALFRFLIIVGLGTTITNCGSENGAPAGSTIEISPKEKKWDTSATAGPPFSFNDQPIVVTVKGPNGKPLNDVEITVSLDLSLGTTPPGDALMFLFEDVDGNGVADPAGYTGPGSPMALTDLAAGALPLPYRTKVGAFGSKQFVLRMAFFGGILSYKGDLNVVSGSAFGSANFEVKCVDGAIACP